MQGPRSKTLFSGQRKARKTHECDNCQSPICKNEDYYVTVLLLIDEYKNRELVIKKSCGLGNCTRFY